MGRPTLTGMIIHVAPEDLTGGAASLQSDGECLRAAAAVLRGAHGDAVHVGDCAVLLDVLTETLETTTIAALTLAEAAATLSDGLVAAASRYAAADAALTHAIGGVR